MPLIIPIFLMNRGCPHRCIFCNERLTAGDHPERITESAFTETVRTHLDSAGRKSGPVQIAFYGGTFTGMEREEQSRLLELAAPFLRGGAVDGIRISTRPDGIDGENLDLLRTSGVTTVEVGAQSLHDGVLLRSRRGHSAADTIRAVALLREKGFETGIHLMAGLPGDSPNRFAETIDRVIALRPDMVRIHPTLVLRDTPLAKAFQEGIYLPLGLRGAVDLCKNALRALTAAGIPVIRLGLQTTRELEKPGAVIAGPFHPAFRSLVETALFLEMATALLSSAGRESGAPALPPADAGVGSPLYFTLSPADVSNFYGAKRENIKILQERFGLACIRISPDPALPRQTLILTVGEKHLRTDYSGQITRIRLQEDTRHGMDHSTQ
ncbi:MAG: radical SAM protein [Deltaproteobacteria bacterium]|nr:radical SAM protein [Deltaproteobacteria bacterium]